MEYLVPAGDKIKLNNLKESLAILDTRTFYHLILSRFNIDPERIPYQAFLLVKIRDSHILDDSDTMRRTVDFLCIDISSEVKKRILAFVSRFDERRDLLSYKGYYKFLYDYLSSEAKITNPISINSKGDFILGSGEIIRFKSAPQAKTLYVLLLSLATKEYPKPTSTKPSHSSKLWTSTNISPPPAISTFRVSMNISPARLMNMPTSSSTRSPSTARFRPRIAGRRISLNISKAYSSTEVR